MERIDKKANIIPSVINNFGYNDVKEFLIKKENMILKNPNPIGQCYMLDESDVLGVGTYGKVV